MAEFPAPQSHGPIEELASDVFFVRGRVRLAPGVRFGRNMAVLRHGDELTVVNAVRLTAAGEEALNALGRVRHVMRIGSFHGLDDAYYVDRYEAPFYCQPGSTHYARPAVDVELGEDTALPIPDATLFVFRDTVQPESAIVIARDGGALLTCDSVQHHPDLAGASVLAKLSMLLMGFKRPANIGPPWRKAMTPKGGSLRRDFERLLEHDFERLLGAHGAPLTGGAHAALEATVRRVFG